MMNLSAFMFQAFLFGTLSCQILTLVQGTTSPTPSLPSAKLLEDAGILQRVYECAHPGLYRYNTKAQMDAHFASLRSEFGRDRTLADSYIAFSQFLAKVKCGHTYANFFNQPKEVVRSLFSGKNRVPLCFRWIGGRMIVTRDLSSQPKLRPGSEILTIDGIRVQDILARLMTIARADGSNDAKRIADLEVMGTGKYEAFDVFLPLFFPQIGERIALLVREPSSSEPVTITVGAQDMEQRTAIAKQNDQPLRGASEPLWRFEQLDERTAYLRMRSWALYNSKWDWQGFLERGIDDLVAKRIPGLIIDLRGNEGGLDVGNTLIAGSRPISSGTTVTKDTPATARYHYPSRSTRIWTRGTGRSRTGARRPAASETGSSA